MLDAYIIDRIRRERDAEKRRDGTFTPLRIEVPREPLPPREETGRDEDERGSVVIDFTV